MLAQVRQHPPVQQIQNGCAGCNCGNIKNLHASRHAVWPGLCWDETISREASKHRESTSAELPMTSAVIDLPYEYRLCNSSSSRLVKQLDAYLSQIAHSICSEISSNKEFRFKRHLAPALEPCSDPQISEVWGLESSVFQHSRFEIN